ncbi:glycoside hydrolase family 43 [Fibrella aestuarina BUZ 2]|uniref:Glycoside hydrolase family 43 n=1 Tax=Fibrella aestuarina BUZ 2 TaxID=1166018 RepID=I0K894_9BACT|nr:family 43 glycosylhydrolase [Fibrella aestuarina]CCH00347.1 glycoside hydrolase family 43 [Fibrella aestuarina BUZ 2]
MKPKKIDTRLVILALFLTYGTLLAQRSAGDKSVYNEVKTYVNPVLPGDHPDPTMLRVGDDFYHCGSSFHFTPYLPIYHSKDMVHWEVISRVVPPTASFVTDRPSAGIWQGAITYFYGSYWIYFSANGQWFSKASDPKGPWSEPVRVKGDPKTGPLGYDNSIFVDDDGKPYMVIKNGQKTNRIQELGRDGQLTSSVIDLDWVNAKLQYSWAEGPVMCKRNGYYYYFPAGDVSGGQYAMRGKALTADSTQWERLGDFFKPITDPKTGFRRPNHISAPIQLADGTWWTIGQSYEKPLQGADWSGMGRQTSLYQVIWEGDRPWGLAPTTKPVPKPNLPKSGIRWRSAQSDQFDSETLSMNWHFLTKRAANRYSLSARKGWVRLSPDTARVHLMQKETDHYYSAVTRVDLNAGDAATKAGLYLTNGNQRVFVQLYSGFDTGKTLVFKLDTAVRMVPNSIGNVVWLKVERNEHQLSGYYSGDGRKWSSIGAPISAENLDKSQPNFNSWVGTSLGLFAEGKPADFDFFVCKDGFSSLPAVGYSNYYGVEKVGEAAEAGVTNDSDQGGWFMLSGVDLGSGNEAAKQIQVQLSASTSGTLELWLDDLTSGKKMASIPFKSTGGKTDWKTVRQSIKGVSGHHDVFVKFPAGQANVATIKALQFQK